VSAQYASPFSRPHNVWSPAQFDVHAASWQTRPLGHFESQFPQ